MSATATRRRPALPKIADLTELVESYSIRNEGESPLRIDEDQAIIYGVKLGGRFSSNCHGIKDVTAGTEYKAAAYKSALSLYEGRKVYIKHSRSQKGGDRGPFEYMGVIRNARYDDAADCPRGDFHYRKTHPETPSLLEDIKRGLGGFGFSHHIPPGGFTGQVVNGRLVVESIKEIKSVDLVDDPATTRNLWEHRERGKTMATTFKAILESWIADKSPARKAVADRLLEDGEAPAMDAPVDTPAPEEPPSDPEDELWNGFMSAIIAIINGDGSAADKAKQVAKYLKAHEKLTQAPEPTEADAEPPADDSGGTKESRETHELKARIACLEHGIKSPTPALLKALTLLDSDIDRKALIEQTRQANTAPARKPTSGGPPRQPSRTTGQTIPTGDAFRRSIKD